jgi:hypothetical protein
MPNSKTENKITKDKTNHNKQQQPLKTQKTTINSENKAPSARIN